MKIHIVRIVESNGSRGDHIFDDSNEAEKFRKNNLEKIWGWTIVEEPCLVKHLCGQVTDHRRNSGNSLSVH